MLHYSRKPALVVLIGAVAICCVFRAAHASSRGAAADMAHWPLERLEIAVADEHATGQTWFYLGERLMERKDFAHAAAAYRRAIRLSPNLDQAPAAYAMALAQAGDSADLAACVREMISIDPKQAQAVLENPVCRRCLGYSEFASLDQEARLQAMD